MKKRTETKALLMKQYDASPKFWDILRSSAATSASYGIWRQKPYETVIVFPLCLIAVHVCSIALQFRTVIITESFDGV
jgi:hypothetical protein